MLQNPSVFGSIICWSEQDGETVLVDFGNSLLENDVLPRVYGHSKAAGFKGK